MAYSADLRERIVRAIQRGDRSQAEIAADFEVSVSCVEEVWRRYRETGSWAIKVWRPGPRPKLSGREERVQAELAQHPDLRLIDLCERVRAADGSAVSISAMSRLLQRLGITRKKRASMPANRKRPA